MKYWLNSNKEEAEWQALHRVIGYLQGRRESTEQIDIDELLQYIEKSVKEIHDFLNENFPEYAAQ